MEKSEGELTLLVELINARLEKLDCRLLSSFQFLHAGYPSETLKRFLKAREYDIEKAFAMLENCLKWRVQNDIDRILMKPLKGAKLEKIRSSQLYGMTGYDNQGRPVLVVRVGLSMQDPSCEVEDYVFSHIQHNEYRDRVLLPEISKKLGKPITAGVKIYDMTGLKFSHLSRMKMERAIAQVDDLYYPEKSNVYYVVNAPTVFSTCWKVVSPLLQERTRRKIRVLDGSGKRELLHDMPEEALPSFVRFPPPPETLLRTFSSSRLTAPDPALSPAATEDCCAITHMYHQQMQQYIVQQQQHHKQAMAANTLSPVPSYIQLHCDTRSNQVEELENLVLQ